MAQIKPLIPKGGLGCWDIIEHLPVAGYLLEWRVYGLSHMEKSQVLFCANGSLSRDYNNYSSEQTKN